jgi:hypothetical protein
MILRRKCLSLLLLLLLLLLKSNLQLNPNQFYSHPSYKRPISTILSKDVHISSKMALKITLPFTDGEMMMKMEQAHLYFILIC